MAARALFATLVLVGGCLGGSGTPGERCGSGNAVVDCDGACVTAAYLQDGTCHADGPNFACAALDFDGGDCGTCGDGVRNPGEACDDGNTRNDDGCSDGCQVEAPPETGRDVDTGPAACGDGFVNPGEDCDDGNLVNGDGCTKNCTIEPFQRDVDFFAMGIFFGIDDAGRFSPIFVDRVREPPRVEVVLARPDPGAPDGLLRCELLYRPNGNPSASPATGPNATPLQQWLDANDAVWGFEVVPGADTYETRFGDDCYLDLDDYAGDAHASYLGTEPVRVGLSETLSASAETLYDDAYADNFGPRDSVVLLGVVVEGPTSLYGTRRRLTRGFAVIAPADLNDDDELVVPTGTPWLSTPPAVVEGAPIRAWYLGFTPGTRLENVVP